jgi:hypothetical protein
MVVVELTRWPSATRPPLGKVIEVLGGPDEPGVDTRIIVRKHALPDVHGEEALVEARRLGSSVHERDLEKRTDFRHALTSYLDLVALERGAGAGPTEALEAAAQIGGGWAFARIAAALDASRKASRPPWEGLAALAAQTGVAELSDIADIAEVAGHEGARILQTLTARAESMRAEALAVTKAKAGARSTTMVVPIALLGAGFLLLIIFPVVYRIFG